MVRAGKMEMIRGRSASQPPQTEASDIGTYFKLLLRGSPWGKTMFLTKPQGFQESSVSVTAHWLPSLPKTFTLVLGFEWEYRLCLLSASNELWATTVSGRGDTRLPAPIPANCMASGNATDISAPHSSEGKPWGRLAGLVLRRVCSSH